jgi:hypothetical protein
VLDDDVRLAIEIKAGKLDLICPEMELLVCPSYDEVALKGMGVIRSDELGKLYFRMISASSGAPHRSLLSSKRPGETYEPDDYVMLRAIDEAEREWRSNRLIVNLGNQIPLPHYLVRQNISTVLHSHERDVSEYSSVRIVVPNSPGVPLDAVTRTSRSVAGRDIGWSSAVDHHSHQIGEAEVTFRSEESGFLSISANMRGDFAPMWAELLCHAIGFATAETIRPALVTREFNGREDLELRSGPFLRYTSMMPRPIYSRGPERAGDFWRLVEVFFSYVSQEMQESKQHQLLDELEGIRRGSQGSLQTASLTLAVGMESIAKLLLDPQLHTSICGKVLEDLLRHLDAWLGDSDIKRRVRGALSGLNAVRASDLMYAWAEQTGNSKTLIDAWKKLRNPRVHGSVLDESEGWNLYCSVVELMHRVVATVIGYDGPITKTSELGWGME